MRALKPLAVVLTCLIGLFVFINSQDNREAKTIAPLPDELQQHVADTIATLKVPSGDALTADEPVPGNATIAAVEPKIHDAFDEIAFELIAKWEGKRNTAYLDIVDVATICFGHTRTVTVADVRAKLTWSDEQCKALLIEELQEYRVGWLHYVNADAQDLWLPPEREAAFTSLAFNVGISGAGKSTATRRLNAGQLPGACTAITWWNKAGGRVVRGLVNRRTEEYELCMRGL